MEVKLADNKDCTGCSLCSNVCPTDAIHMKPKADGFCYPQVEASRCIRCKACVRACPAISDSSWQPEQRRGFAAVLLNARELHRAASGGAATALYRIFLERGYYVAGVNQRNEYVLTNREEDIFQFQGSKYIETEKKKIYQEILRLLGRKKKVLFIGLPCECAALKKMVAEEEPLILCSLICHGPTSPLVLEKFREEAGRNVQGVVMRAKDVNHVLVVKMISKDGTIKEQPFYANNFGKAFELYGRESCYHCRFKSGTSGADISIGDLWGLRSFGEKLPENSTSFIAVHTNKGLEIVELMKKEMEILPVDFDQAVSYNSMFESSREMKCNRFLFQCNLRERGLSYAIRKELGNSWFLEKTKKNFKYKWKRKIRR